MELFLQPRNRNIVEDYFQNISNVRIKKILRRHFVTNVAKENQYNYIS